MKKLFFLTTIVYFYWLLVKALHLTWSEAFVLTTTLLLFLQGIFFSIAMLHAWKDPKTPRKITPPSRVSVYPKRKFTLLLPVRHEEEVIKQTLHSMAKISYPKKLFEVLTIARADDLGTIEKVKEALTEIQNENFKLIIFDGLPINKAKGLNIGLKKARGELIAVFDAEDEPNPNLLRVIDTFLDYNPETDVVQGGVQLINVSSAWFSSLACLEYYFWFKSVLPLFSFLGSTPLGGNTVFFKKEVLKRIGGWDQQCLTEDAEIGLRVAAAGYKISMIYNESLATLEETPPDTMSFVKQRTRWIQGYLQTISRGYWARQKGIQRKALSLWLLVQPIIHQFLTALFVIGPLMAFFIKVPLVLSLLSFLPLYFLLLQWGAMIIGLQHLKKSYQLKFSIFLYPKLILFYFPYQLIIGYSFLRAVKRLINKNLTWEKTSHYNTHRQYLFSLRTAA